jgi:hypothetical protein
VGDCVRHSQLPAALGLPAVPGVRLCRLLGLLRRLLLPRLLSRRLHRLVARLLLMGMLRCDRSCCCGGEGVTAMSSAGGRMPLACSSQTHCCCRWRDAYSLQL